MAKYRKKPVVIEATQWFKNNDHPLDQDYSHCKGFEPVKTEEGNIVRYYRNPSIDGGVDCSMCQLTMSNHGWIDTLEGGHIVCPEDWVITGVQGEHYSCKPDIFEATYETAE